MNIWKVTCIGTVMRLVRTPDDCIDCPDLCLTLLCDGASEMADARGSPAPLVRGGGRSVSTTSTGCVKLDTCRWLMCACRSRADKYVRLHPDEP